MFRVMTAALAVAAFITGSIALGDSALAHERRQVGPYQFVVGFSAEPALLSVPNGVSLRVSDTRVSPAKPVEGLQETLKVEVFYAGLTRSLALAFRGVFGQPGLYAADFIPTRPGGYSFHITGQIADLQVNERFESGPGRFDEVEAATAIQYPDPVPAGADLSERLASLERDLGSARAFAIVALVLAIVLPIGVAARTRRSTR